MCHLLQLVLARKLSEISARFAIYFSEIRAELQGTKTQVFGEVQPLQPGAGVVEKSSL